ncbi:Fc.00g063000.m01.CDS01 [Cosmosporella sp. VM-42]
MLHRIPIPVNDPWENFNPYTTSNRREHHHQHSSSASKPRSATPVTLEEIKKNAATAKSESSTSTST